MALEDADYIENRGRPCSLRIWRSCLAETEPCSALAREAAQNQLPLLGINVGHVGFMTELEPAELPEMEKLFTGEFSLDSRMMLHVAVQRGGRIGV